MDIKTLSEYLSVLERKTYNRTTFSISSPDIIIFFGNTGCPDTIKENIGRINASSKAFHFLCGINSIIPNKTIRIGSKTWSGYATRWDRAGINNTITQANVSNTAAWITVLLSIAKTILQNYNLPSTMFLSNVHFTSKMTCFSFSNEGTSIPSNFL